jgi:hypothetical protein
MIPEICRVDTEFILQSVRQPNDQTKVYCAVLPELELIRWHHADEDFCAKKLFGRSPHVKGAVITDSSGYQAFIIWTRDWRINNGALAGRLDVLRLVILSNAAPDNREVMVSSLLYAAVMEANEWNVEEIQIWNQTDLILKAAQSYFDKDNLEVVTQRPDNESVACLAWYGNWNIGRTLQNVPNNVDWVANEKYCWC